jgi:glycosyltransferase involved in cell wall biosynthesis
VAKKHIIITKLFEFSGSNTHLKALVKYFGAENIVLILEDADQLQYLKNIDATNRVKHIIISNLHGYAHLRYLWTTNLKELLLILRSILIIKLLSIRYRFADVTISSVEPEKHLYFLWMPLTKVFYILHTTPVKQYTSFTSYTCNKKLGTQKKIITVSRSNKLLISKNWEVTEVKQQFINVVYNCIIEQKAPHKSNTIDDNKINIVTSGHVIGYKNPVMWVNVAAAVTKIMTDVNFLWLGNGPLLETCETMVERNERIVFKGAVTNTDEYLQNATIYYQPSLYETHGIAVVEAMHSSLPCIVSNVGGLPESVVNNYNGLLVDAENHEQHIEVLTKILRDQHKLKTYGQNSFKRFNELFSYDHFKGNMDSIYLSS